MGMIVRKAMKAIKLNKTIIKKIQLLMIKHKHNNVKVILLKSHKNHQ